MLPLKKHQGLAGLCTAALDAILPPRCIATGEIVDAQGMISPLFWKELSFIENPLCETCGMPFGAPALEGSVCAACLDHPPAYDMARAGVAYNDASRQVLLDFKYGDRLQAVHTFVPWLMRAGVRIIGGTDIFVPVPLHPKRLWRRRFNQSALIAQEMAKRTGHDCIPDALLRLRATVPQKGLNRKERNDNVKYAFAVNPKRMVADKNITLIDDVFTSGATLNECARTLKKAGAAAVYVLTVARVTREEF